MTAQFFYFRIDERERIVELRVTRRGERDDSRPSSRFGRSMTRDLSGDYLRLDDLPPTYAEPLREHIRRTGDREGIVEVGSEGEESQDRSDEEGAVAERTSEFADDDRERGDDR